MNLNIFYYLSVIILIITNILFIKYNQYNNKFISTIILLSTIIFLIGNIRLYTNKDEEKYIYVKPNYKPIVISWENPLAQQII
jgi:hypothetical protein